MNHALQLELDSVDGALLRVIGVTERRGWSATALQAEQSHRADTLNLQMQVMGDRPVELLIRQLSKLQDVRSVGVAA